MFAAIENCVTKEACVSEAEDWKHFARCQKASPFFYVYTGCKTSYWRVTSYGFNKICLLSKLCWVLMLMPRWAMFSAPAQLALAFQKYSCTLALLAKIAALNHFLAPLTCARKDPPHADFPTGMEKGVIPSLLLGGGAVWAESCGSRRQLGTGEITWQT